MRDRLMTYGPALLLNLILLVVITFAMLEADIWITIKP